eukprot:279413_1
MKVGQCLKNIHTRLNVTITYQLTYQISYRNASSAMAQVSKTPSQIIDTPTTSLPTPPTPSPSSLTSIPTSSTLIEKLPRATLTRNIPTSHPDYSPNLSYSQLQYLESGEYDISVHDGNGNLLLRDQSPLPQFGKHGVKNLTENDMFEWIKQTEHLYREIYCDMMQIDPDLIYKDKEEHLLKFPFDKDEFFRETQLNKTDIKSWNLLLRIQAYQSNKKYLDSTNDGIIRREKAFLTVLETFREIQSMSQSDDEIINNNNDNNMIINIDTYNTMLYAMSSHKHPNMCIELLREMGNYGINPSQQSYIYLLKAFIKKKQVSEAHDILNYICANCEANSNRIELELYNQVIYGYLKQRRRQEAIKVFDNMMQIDGEHPNTKTYTIMMEYYRQSKNINGAIEILREMEDRGYKPNQITYNAVILAAAYGDIEDYSFKKMFELFDEMVITKEIPPTHHTFSALIIGCGNVYDIETATKCLHLMDKMGIKRTGNTYKSYLKAIANTVRKRNNFITIGSTRNLKTNDLIRLSEGIIKKMQNDIELKEYIDIGIINALLSVYTYGQTINRAIMFFKTMAIRFENVESNRDTLRLLWKACMKSRRYKDAQYIFNIFKVNENNHKMGYGIIKTDMYREMIRLASYYKDINGVVKYLNMMKDKGLMIRGRDKAYLAMIVGSKAEQLEARRRFWKENIKRRKDVTIRQKAKRPGKDLLSFRYWNKDKRGPAEKAAGLRNNNPPRTVGKVYWNINKTLGQLDDPW